MTNSLSPSVVSIRPINILNRSREIHRLVLIYGFYHCSEPRACRPREEVPAAAPAEWHVAGTSAGKSREAGEDANR